MKRARDEDKLDEGWKQGQLKFLKDQKSLNEERERDASARIAPFRGAYSRDPTSLFELQRSNESRTRIPKLAPLNACRGYDAKEPVEYGNYDPVPGSPGEEVILMTKIGQFEKGDKFAHARVNYRTGMVQLFKIADDVRQSEACFNGEFRVPAKTTYHNKQYARDVVDFLRRGHSLLNPQCRCKHDNSRERSTELGITNNQNEKEDRSSIRDGECKISRERKGRTAEEVGQEIAVGDIYYIRGLVEELKQHSNVKVEELCSEGKLTDVFSFRAELEDVHNKQDLLDHITNVQYSVEEHRPANYSVNGMKEPSEAETYNGVKDDVEVLIKEKKLYALESKNAREKGRMLFRKQQLGKSPEDDQVLDQVADTNKLKNMWNMFEPQIKECKNLVSLAKNLKQHGLDSTEVKKTDKEQKRNLKPSRRGSKKATNQYAGRLGKTDQDP